MTDAFEDHRPLLLGIAYQMLGGKADADDVVQEAFLRWNKQDKARVRSDKAWLVATVTRLSIDQLRSARRCREEYVGIWLPEPIVDRENEAVSPVSHAALADSLGLAFMHLLEDLAPVERAVFLLREAFDYEYVEVAKVVGKTEAHCRQLFSRAKRHLGQRDLTEAPSGEQAERVVQQFLRACLTGNMESLIAVLTEDAVMYSDGGGKVRAALRPIRSARFIGRFYLGIRHRSLAGARAEIVRVNGKVGALFRLTDGRVTVLAFAFREDRIASIYWVSNPDKVRAEALTSAGGGPFPERSEETGRTR